MEQGTVKNNLELEERFLRGIRNFPRCDGLSQKWGRKGRGIASPKII